MGAPDPEDAFVRKVEQKAEQLKRARRSSTDPLRGMLAAIGIGWSVALPAAGCGFLGALLGRHYDLPHAALVGVAIGVLIGVYVAYRQVRRALDEGEGPQQKDE